ncbi:hypothetical protein LJC30_03135 [Odoribacter sp. OttesenSCG-928-L07]|nr:hypothetical protein [Odoribacter sp. OttesenSCG-928-L07]MDL2239094.1 hypothetical protein [Bacteroidales bacterium OttesenSCG-928-L14]MDL2240007.1 hypothetical protein [Bacteroidales bacterium OttesenSCG-928-K22]
MDIEQIKVEVIAKVQKELELQENKTTGFGLDKLNYLQEYLSKFDDFSHKVVDILNEVLQSHNVNFNYEEKSSFIAYIKPTIEDLLKKYIIN